jgi:prepilin-type N-terminal cleavage/methylation domain-containing protein
MPGKPEEHDARGMSLVEILVAMFILSIASIASAHIVLAGMSMDVKDSTFTQATNSAQKAIEQIRCDCAAGRLKEFLDFYHPTRNPSVPAYQRVAESSRLIYHIDVKEHADLAEIPGGLMKVYVSIYALDEGYLQQTGTLRPNALRYSRGFIARLCTYIDEQ